MNVLWIFMPYSLLDTDVTEAPAILETSHTCATTTSLSYCRIIVIVIRLSCSMPNELLESHVFVSL